MHRLRRNFCFSDTLNQLQIPKFDTYQQEADFWGGIDIANLFIFPLGFANESPFSRPVSIG